MAQIFAYGHGLLGNIPSQVPSLTQTPGILILILPAIHMVIIHTTLVTPTTPTTTTIRIILTTGILAQTPIGMALLGSIVSGRRVKSKSEWRGRSFYI